MDTNFFTFIKRDHYKCANAKHSDSIHTLKRTKRDDDRLMTKWARSGPRDSCPGVSSLRRWAVRAAAAPGCEWVTVRHVHTAYDDSLLF